MKLYYYLLFRLYTQLMNPKNQNDEKTSIIVTTATSSLIIWISIYILILFIDLYISKISNVILPNKTFYFIYIMLIYFCNYWFFIKDKKFLNYNFKSDKKGGYTIIGFIVILALTFVFIANKNRDKIFKERAKTRIEANQ